MITAPGLPESVSAWCHSGMALLSGPRHDPPILPTRNMIDAISHLADDVAEAFGLAGSPLHMLADRAALLGLRRGGAWSCGRACRIVRAEDGWIAVNLARPDDFDLIPAWLGSRPSWPAVMRTIGRRCVAELLDDAWELGLAVSGVNEAPTQTQCPAERGVNRVFFAKPGGHRDCAHDPPLIIDLSSLWAGPLCGSLLAQAGARVVKIESERRPDPIRETCPPHFDLLNGGKESVVLDLQSAAGRRQLLALVASADAVITSARPRALAQLGLAPEVLFARKESLTWVAITGHGWSGDQANRIGFGDDAAIAGGLMIVMPDGSPGFLGDAIADPLSGLTAALGALDAIRKGGGVLLDVGMSRVSRFLAQAGDPTPDYAIMKSGRHWTATNGLSTQRLSHPVAPRATMAARPLGADTASVLAGLS